MNSLSAFPPLVLAAAKAPSGPAQPMTEAAALAVLQSGAEVHDKARACQELAVTATRAAVPALAALLADEHLSDYARSGLEAIPDPSAGAALRQALSGLEGRRLAGVINSLGVRREIAAVSDLQRLALDPKRGAGAEALSALGSIGTGDAARTIQKALADGPADLRVPAAHAAFAAAEQLRKDGKASVARGLLETVARVLPKGHLAAVAISLLASLGSAAGAPPRS
jgi:HEAT repeat protein